MAKKQTKKPVETESIVETESEIVPVFENSCEFKLISKVSEENATTTIEGLAIEGRGVLLMVSRNVGGFDTQCASAFIENATIEEIKEGDEVIKRKIIKAPR